MVISSEEIQNCGYCNVFEVLQMQIQNIGMIQGEDYGNIWQLVVNVFNLCDFGFNYMLVLINGWCVVDYLIVYGGLVNFINLVNILVVMIDCIEIFSGGVLVIYGLDVIVGVVNIVLKKKFDGVDVNLCVGIIECGGGDNQCL